MQWIAIGSRGQYGDTAEAGMEHEEAKKLSGTWCVLVVFAYFPLRVANLPLLTGSPLNTPSSSPTNTVFSASRSTSSPTRRTALLSPTLLRRRELRRKTCVDRRTILLILCNTEHLFSYSLPPSAPLARSAPAFLPLSPTSLPAPTPKPSPALPVPASPSSKPSSALTAEL
jgi:hypothetical protein